MESVKNLRKVPFPQWGGSAQYARRLVPMLPAHEVYVEPFCGAAALFYAKEPARVEVLADLDPEVTFAHRYIQQLTGNKLAALRRFPWKVSRRGQRMAQRTIPVSNSERVWKHIYCRTATWGAKPTCQGFASINDGDRYDLNQLWRFKERLAGVKILTQDWQWTINQFDSRSTLFFIDPPYVEEWDISEGISPEEIASQVSKVKGNYLIAYTDSARARRAFANSGHQFKLRIMESKRVGVFKKRTRLFVRSWDETNVWLTPSQIAHRLLQIVAAIRRS